MAMTHETLTTIVASGTECERTLAAEVLRVRAALAEAESAREITQSLLRQLEESERMQYDLRKRLRDTVFESIQKGA